MGVLFDQETVNIVYVIQCNQTKAHKGSGEIVQILTFWHFLWGYILENQRQKKLIDFNRWATDNKECGSY